MASNGFFGLAPPSCDSRARGTPGNVIHCEREQAASILTARSGRSTAMSLARNAVMMLSVHFHDCCSAGPRHPAGAHATGNETRQRGGSLTGDQFKGLRFLGSQLRGCSAHDLFEDLRGGIGVAVVAMPERHFFERGVAFFFGRIPEQTLPIVAEDFSQSVGWR